jgi:hypothetical protein
MLVAAALALAVLGTAAVKAPPSEERGPTFLAAGDRLAVGEATGDDGLSARAAYLLAFHEAQDVLDVGGMLVAAARLERIQESALAAHVRRVAADVAAELATRR